MSNEQQKQLCMAHMHRYVLARTQDGMEIDGIVENVDDENLYLAVPISCDEGMEARQPIGGYGFGYGNPYGVYGYPSYGYPYGGFYGPFGRPRRFRRQIFPLAALLALSLLPYY